MSGGAEIIKMKHTSIMHITLLGPTHIQDSRQDYACLKLLDGKFCIRKGLQITSYKIQFCTKFYWSKIEFELICDICRSKIG